MTKRLGEKLKSKAKATEIEQHPLVKKLRSDNARLLKQQQHGVEADRRVLRLESDKRELAARHKSLLGDLAAAERRWELLCGLAEFGRSDSPKFVPHKPRGKATAIAVMNDWHVEEKVDREVVNGKNEHNLQISKARSRKVFQNCVMMLDVARRLSNIRDLVLAALGDFITGYIHEELEESNYLSPSEAILFATEQLCWGIDYLLANTDLEHITIPTCFGNHGRTQKKKRIATGYKNSFEWLMYNFMAMTYRDEPRVTFKIGKGAHNWLDVQGKPIRFQHGDAVRYQGGVGGVSIPLLKAIAQWDKVQVAFVDILAHWHQHLRGRKFILSNCLIGYAPYSIEIKAEWSEPSQTFAVIDRDRDNVVFCEELFCN